MEKEIKEQEKEMWKHTAEVYRHRYETMRTLAIANALITSIIALLIIAMRF